MQHVKLLCAKCATPLAPTMTGPRCPRFSACGYGGIVETLDFQPGTTFTAWATNVRA